MRPAIKTAALITSLMFSVAIGNVRANDAQWREDLDVFETTLPQKHIAFYKLMPQQKFEQEIADIKQSASTLTDQQIILRLVRLVAALGVAHSSVVLPQTGPMAFHQYALEFHWFSDGLTIVASAPQYQSALGARVERIGTMTPREIENKLAPFISHENDAWLHAQSPASMTMVELLQSLNLTDAHGRFDLAVTTPDGKSLTLSISPPKPGTTILIPAQEALHIPPPLFARHRDFYWYEYLQDSQTLYIQYRVCENDPGNPFSTFAKQLLDFADSHPVARTVVDLRFNGGGDSRIITPLLEGIKARPALNAKGRLFVLIGPMTFSSGEWTAEEFHNSFAFLTSDLVDGFYWSRPADTHAWKIRFKATFVGEPTGGKPNNYGDVNYFQLPNSKLIVNYAVKHFQLTDDGDPPSRDPDVLITRSREDFLAGRDPVLDAVINLPAK
jgi:hypothetical protein